MHFDIAVIGAGIAGASIASAVAEHRSVLMLEAEAQPGYHATGRSAAFWTESYGGPGVQPLTTASREFLVSPPPEYAERGFLEPRGALHIGKTGQGSLADRLRAEFVATSLQFDRLDRAGILTHVAAMRPEWTVGLWEPECCDIDVAAMHGAYLRHAAKNGASLACNAMLTAARYSEGRWHLQSRSGSYSCDLLINAAGAWADAVAHICAIPSVGITPFRRTVLQIQTDPAPPADLPLVIGLDGSFYFKPESGGRIWLSPHDETPAEACDAAPEEIDVALAIDRFEQAVDWQIVRLEHKWAGLRSFAPDRLPVIGCDPANPQFFWAAGQGGFGIQTAPAAAQLAASLLIDGMSAPDGVDPSLYLPDRFR